MEGCMKMGTIGIIVPSCDVWRMCGDCDRQKLVAGLNQKVYVILFSIVSFGKSCPLSFSSFKNSMRKLYVITTFCFHLLSVSAFFFLQCMRKLKIHFT